VVKPDGKRGYLSTGVLTWFINGLDPDPRSWKVQVETPERGASTSY
jgi:hypothetical protein